MQAIYQRICEYLELGERVEVLNARFAVSVGTKCANLACSTSGVPLLLRHLFSKAWGATLC